MGDINNNVFIKMFNESFSVKELAEKMGYYKPNSESNFAPHIYRKIKRKCHELNIDYCKLTGHRNNIKNIDKELLEKIVKGSFSMRELISKLGLKTNSGSLYPAIHNRLRHFKINTTHFMGRSWSRGKNRFTDSRINAQAENAETPWVDSFKHGSLVRNDQLMQRLILNKKREYKCEICGINKWNEKPIRLRLDHIDGDSINNIEENLRFLCPNCDSQTASFCRGTRKPAGKIYWWQKLVDPEKYGEKITENIHGSVKRPYRPRPNKRKVNRPSKEDLQNDVQSMSMCAVGRKYGVSDNAIRKWIKWYNL